MLRGGTGEMRQLTVHAGAVLTELTERALRYGLSMVKMAGGGLRPQLQPSNSYERRLLPEVVHPDDAGIGFAEASCQCLPLPSHLLQGTPCFSKPFPVTLLHHHVSANTRALQDFCSPMLIICKADKMTQCNAMAETCKQVGALGKPKMVLREVVQLPLQQPALFAKGSLARPTKGILLFGPPGAPCSPACWACRAHMDSVTLLCLAGSGVSALPKSGM